MCNRKGKPKDERWDYISSQPYREKTAMAPRVA